MTNTTAPGDKNAALSGRPSSVPPAPGPSAGVFFTLGHSRHSIPELAELLRRHGVVRLVDVRSSPNSRANPQHAHDTLAADLPRLGVRYEWRKVLGGREEPHGNLPARLLGNGAVQAAMADLIQSATGRGGGPAGTDGAAAVERDGADGVGDAAAHHPQKKRGGSGAMPTALMCSEAQWRECHRQYLAAYLTDVAGLPVHHILPDGRLEPHPSRWCAELLLALPAQGGAAGPTTRAGIPPSAAEGAGRGAVGINPAASVSTSAVPAAGGAPPKRKGKSRLQ